MNPDPHPIIARNNVRVFGRGRRPMLFAHGFGCDQNMWRFLTPAFEDDYRIVLFDYVGSGKSDWRAYNAERYSALHGYAEDIVDICAALDLKDVILVGHSVSAVIGILAAIQARRFFSALILVCPSPRYMNEPPDYVGGFERKDLEALLDTMDQNYIGWAQGLAPVIMGAPEKSDLTEELAESFCSTDPEIAKRFARATFLSDNRQDLPKVRLPSLILQCSEDVVAPRAVGQYVHDQMAQSTLTILNATGHCPHMSAPEETIVAIKDYLRSLGRSRGAVHDYSSHR
jgi:sigma-B regulation protein RsbQ